MLVLSAADVQAVVPMVDAIDAVAAAFAQLADGSAEVPLRSHIASPEHAATTFIMPARMTGSEPALGMKVVSVFPHASPAVQALVALLDPGSGAPLALLDGTYLTALRTGAASGAATRLMARDDAQVLALFGAGAQAFTQVLAICAVRPIARLWLHNRSRERATQLIARLHAAGLQFDMQIAESPAQALAEADVVCCATSSVQPLFADHELHDGTHINGIGSYRPDMAEIPPATVARARLIVDQRVAAWAEAGDLVQARAAGLIGAQAIAGELGEVAAGRVAGRTARDEITLFKSVGNAVQDLAVAALAVARARQLGRGVELRL